jgi:hypothetical protein
MLLPLAIDTSIRRDEAELGDLRRGSVNPDQGACGEVSALITRYEPPGF